MNAKKNVNYNVDEVKQKLVDYLYSCLDMSKYKYTILKTKSDLNILRETDHHVSPNFSGKNGFVVFKKINDIYYSILIDRKTLKYNKFHIKIKNVNVIPVSIKARANIYDGTIFDGKLININRGSEKIFMITDVFYLEGNDLTYDNLEDKLDNIKTYLKKHTKPSHKMSFEINKLYAYDDINKIVKMDTPYNIYGIIFYPKISGITHLFNNIHKKNSVKSKTNLEKNTHAHIQFRKRDLPDVYDTYILGDNNKFLKNGIAYIPTIKMSRYCKSIFNEFKNNMLIFKCIYNNMFNKWEPIEIANGVEYPDTLENIKKLIV